MKLIHILSEHHSQELRFGLYLVENNLVVSNTSKVYFILKQCTKKRLGKYVYVGNDSGEIYDCQVENLKLWIDKLLETEKNLDFKIIEFENSFGISKIPFLYKKALMNSFICSEDSSDYYNLI